MRCNSGLGEVEHAAFQVGIYSGGRDSWADLQPASWSKLQTGEVSAAMSDDNIEAAYLSTFSV